MPKPFQRVLRAAVGKQRKHERKVRGAAVYLFAGAKPLGEGTLIDESASGAQVKCQNAHVLAMATFALDPRTAEVKQLELAWQDGARAGFRYVSVQTVKGYVSDPRLQYIKEFWASLPADTSRSTKTFARA